MFSNNEKWDSAKHEGLFDWYSRESDNYYMPYYRPIDNKMTVESRILCQTGHLIPICFKAADKSKSAEALANSESSKTFTNPAFLSIVMVLVALVFSLAVALFVLVRKLKTLKKRLPVSAN